ncbi:MAG: hypothetical protein M1495_24970, partial [Bacteroidetes bacterium]|nr:hypothetical protein [Bacteroidota bacterium]
LSLRRIQETFYQSADRYHYLKMNCSNESPHSDPLRLARLDLMSIRGWHPQRGEAEKYLKTNYILFALKGRELILVRFRLRIKSRKSIAAIPGSSKDSILISKY